MSPSTPAPATWSSASVAIAAGSHLEVSDDGCGFDPAGHLEAPCNGHIGLASVEHRVHALGGSMEIVAGPETGTDVSVRLPAGSGRSPDHRSRRRQRPAGRLASKLRTLRPEGPAPPVWGSANRPQEWSK